jgi:anti-sigma B factor antagonist
MTTDVEQVGDVTVVTVQAEQLDAGNADEFRELMTPVLAGCRNLVLDLGKVQFVDSRGCGALLSCLKQVSGHGGDLKLCCVTKFARNALNLMRFHHLCEITDTRDQALQAFQK